MFEKTFSFWRRLVGKSSEPTARHPQADRRLWTRYASDFPIRVQLANDGENQAVTARVRDISLGGANLVLDRPFETGQILTLDLPCRPGEDANTVLACVVRVSGEKSGEWSMGCVFSRELTEEDMAGFGAKKERHDPRDQRTWVRFACNCTVQFEKVGDPANQSWQAKVLNISASGIGLMTEEPVGAGALLNLELRSQSGKPVKTILACVVHVTHQQTGAWALGCNFIRQLTEQDLQQLI